MSIVKMLLSIDVVIFATQSRCIRLGMYLQSARENKNQTKFKIQKTKKLPKNLQKWCQKIISINGRKFLRYVYSSGF